MSKLGKTLLRGVALGLGMDEEWFEKNLCATQPTELFRIFHYPPPEIKEGEHPGWGVGEHSDYGLITLLA
jgi:isopenicillin N synthase-like dioxygenase